ncbi:methylenetetrahydrofolate dehydrogenase (NADP+), methenyltetrahydrofolate cyclohydrolase [Mycoplasmopsis maculosa]|uniref:Bifunctional protein FolD n=1 Tax=Mycoplasmopsis maculosa TaxID=114885 RepID=A0A449B4K7_9BACT|nr:bifunctional 5,10-methylenetetrahydrofolate dehydrogenase/5,10-methenyltetrahydrofolate cyclohydrolase [Mycoplasmopsis maculosa]VEU75468.1 methylenetetrahydrofolate dehydrogenase (NADP+), methenyltetrahydrofolate cyclohydrolase [Mycoplasmopsis maculosa]
MILDGKKIAEIRTKELIEEFQFIAKTINRKPVLAIVQVGDLNASNLYIKHKINKANELGVQVDLYKFKEDITQNMLLKKLDEINEKADGIIVQLPLPEKISSQLILNGIRLIKDVDGLCTKSTFNFYNENNELTYTPATAAAIMDIIEYYKIDIKDKKVAVIGRSYLVGKPTAFLLKKLGGNVSTYNRKTGIKGVESADILVSAAGQANLVKKENIKQGAVVIDAGTNWIIDEKTNKKIMVGDVNLEGDFDYVSSYTPVPGGVGPLTVVWLFKNLAKAIRTEYEF